MREVFIKRYEDAIKAYFNYPESGEGKRVKWYIMDEYENILLQVFDMDYLDVRKIYDELYDERYMQEE